MNAKLSLLISLFLLFHKANAFNINTILSQYPDFSSFNDYLTKTNVASEINSRQTITVLAVENNHLSPVSGKPQDVVKNILSLHVILDYFDVPKLQKLASGSTILTTLFQASGLAKGQQGFLNVTRLNTDSVAFGSAAPGSTLGSNLVKSIASEPYNISVLQVSNVIIPPGIDGSTGSPSNNSGSAPGSPSVAPSASPKASPTPSTSEDSSPPSMAPSKSQPTAPSSSSPSMAPSKSQPTAPSASPAMGPSTSSGALAPSNAPSSASSPSEAATPSANPDSPPMPGAPAANAPAADAPAADAPAANAPAPDAPTADTPPSAGMALQINVVAAFATTLLSVLCIALRV